jgi:hypothetical protein
VTEGLGCYPDSDILCRVLKLAVTDNSNEGLQPFAEGDKVQIFNSLSFSFSLFKREMSRSDRGILPSLI